MSHNNLASLTTVIGLTINGVGLIFVATQVVLARRQINDNLKRSIEEADRVKRQATVEFYMATMKKVGEWRSKLPADWDKRAIDAYVRNAYRRRHEDKIRVLANYLQYYEALSVAVLSDVYDKRIIDSIAGSRIMNIAENYAGFFVARRKEVGADTAYRNLEQLGYAIREFRKSPGYRGLAWRDAGRLG